MLRRNFPLARLRRGFAVPTPRREDATVLPAALAALLLAMLAVQLALPIDVDVAATPLDVERGPRMIAVPQAAPLWADNGIVGHNLFAPGRSQVGVMGKVPGTALGGVTVAGTVGEGAKMRAVIVRPQGTIVMLSRGQRINDWQLARLFPDHAEFRRGTDKLETPYGGAIPQAADAGERPEQ